MAERRLDASLELIADQRRRRIIQHFRQNSTEELTVDELVDRLLSHESTDLDSDSENRTALKIHLHHVDLPKLAEHGLIDYDPERAIVRYQSNDGIGQLLDFIPDESA